MNVRDFLSPPGLMLIVAVAAIGWDLWSHRTRPEIEERHGVLYFHDVPCSKDCSGHVTGYQWAKKHDIEGPDDCGGNSQSFIEGCKIYAEEMQAAQDYTPDDPDPSPM